MPGCFKQPAKRLNVPQGDVLAEVTLKDLIQSPVQPDTQLLLKSRELHQVDGSPEYPSRYSREMETKDLGHTRSPAKLGRGFIAAAIWRGTTRLVKSSIWAGWTSR